MLSNQELKKEEQNLTYTLDIIKTKLDELKIDIKNYNEKLQEFRNYVWVDCKALATSLDFDRRLEFASLLGEQQQQEYHFDSKIKTKNKLVKSYKSPYFGKIIFNNDNIYIGSSQINDDLEIIVYDWRAPVSSMFYDFGIGNAKYIVNGKIINGNITQKRQFVIEDSKLISAIENEQNIDDELLQEILSKESTDKMTNIINTIQKEQNQVIRNLKDNIVITEGVAGSGKTEIALHRIAYLLYHKEKYNSGNILILSPNNIFSEYISNVLPELSEENVLCTTISLFANKYIDKEIESYTSFLDRIYNTKIDVKEFDESYKNDLDLFLDNYSKNLSFTKSISLNDKKLTKDELNELLSKYKYLNIIERLNRITDYIIGKTHLKKKYYNIIRSKLILILNKTIDPISIYNEFLKENNKTTIDSIVYYEHITPLLYTIFYINDYPENDNIKHVVIDEAQDYSIFQIYLFKKIFINASFTILGDINQNLNPYISFNSLNDFSKIFPKTSYYKLEKAYRSSKNIMDYASSILNIKINCFRHEGTKVLEKTINENLKEELITYLKNQNKRTAILTKSKKESSYIYKLLSDNIDVSSPLFDNKNTNYIILPVYLAKGLEFDTVIIYNANLFSKKLLYVAVTRAQNNLIIYK